MHRNRQDWLEVPPTTHSSDGLPMPLTMLSFAMKQKTLVSLHEHPWGQWMYAEKGVIHVLADQQDFIMTPQRAVWIPPNTLHTVSTTEGTQLSSVYLALSEAYRLPNVCTVYAVADFLKAIIKEAIKWPADYCWDSEQGRIFRVLSDQIHQAEVIKSPLPMPTDKRLKALCDALIQSPADDRSLAQWGERVGASDRTLSRLFRQEVGMGFRQWRQMLRVYLAMAYLQAGQSVTDVALALGYGSASVFIAIFKQSLGITPATYIKQYSMQSCGI